MRAEEAPSYKRLVGSLAALQSDEGVFLNRKLVGYGMTPEQLADAEKLAHKWWEQRQPNQFGE